MKLIAPDYFGEFACIKGECRHSCCIGWEIDIDDDTLSYYRGLTGNTADKLRENIEFADGGAHFKLGRDERCPFLNDQGLCDLIIEYGDGALCQICADHPRFRNYFSDRVEIGLGLCCEAAARLILTRKESVQFCILEDDFEEEELYEDEIAALDLRAELIEIAQNRCLTMDERIRSMMNAAGITLPEIDYPHWRNFLGHLERLDDEWLVHLDALLQPQTVRDQDIPLEQLMVYLLQRHLHAEDDDLSGRTAFCILMWHFIRAMLPSDSEDGLIEIARMYSSEIEYSDENISAILDEIHRLYPQI